MDTANLLLLLAGVAGTWIGAELLVRGSAYLALALGIRPMVVGLTVVAFGTSSPEAVASFVAAGKGSAGIAVGNVLGSNIANVGLILGTVCLLHPLRVNWAELRRDVVVMVLATFTAAGFMFAHALGRVAGIVLLSMLVTSLVLTIRTSRRDRATDRLLEGVEPSTTGGRRQVALAAVRAVTGLAILIVGAEALVRGAMELGLALGISDEVIGGTVVAVGTSLPELAASLVAVMRGHHDIGIGNIVGSNVMNLLFVLGGVCLLAPQPVSSEVVGFLLPVTLAFTLVLVPMLALGRHVSRVEGGVLLAGYLAFAVTSYL